MKEKTEYMTMEQMLLMIEGINGEVCRKISQECMSLFHIGYGSRSNHQAWPGGYNDHITETMNIGMRLYEWLSSLRPLPFSIADVILVIFLHDLEKPWKYEKHLQNGGKLQVREGLRTKEECHEFRQRLIKQYGIELTPDQQNALKHIEGADEHYSPEERGMGELAALCHMADVASARLWHDFPAVTDDPWRGARRCNTNS